MLPSTPPRALAAAALTLSTAAVVLSAAPSQAASRVSALSTSVTVTGSSVAATTVLSTSRPFAAAAAGVCARDAAGAKRDFPMSNGVWITRAGTTISRTQTLAPGVYTYWPCALVEGVWQSLSPSKSFTVAGPSGGAAPAAPAAAATPIPGNVVDLNGQSFTIDTTRWTAFGSPVTAAETLDPAKVIDGTRAMRVVATATGDGLMHLNPRAPGIVGGSTYRASTWLRPEQAGRTGTVRLAWYDSSGAWLSARDSTVPLAGAGTAVKLQLEAVAPAGATEALVSVGLVGAAPQDAYTFDRTYVGTGSDPAGPQLPTPVPQPAGPTTMPSALTLPPSTGAPNGWTRVLAEDFTTDVAAPNFRSAYPGVDAYPASWTNRASDSYTSWYGGGQTISVAGGVSRQRVATDATGKHRTETLVPEATKSMLYGRYSLRWRVPNALPGYKIAWLLWPSSEIWPRDGEIDFPEGGLASDGRIDAFMHRQGAVSGGDQDAHSTGVSTTGPAWHTSEIVWAPGFVQFVLDGVVIGTSTSRVPNTPMGWRIQTEGNLEGTSTNTGISPMTAGDVEIDWIAAYARNS